MHPKGETRPAGFGHLMNASGLSLGPAQDRGHILAKARAALAIYKSDEKAILAHRSGASIVGAELVTR